MQCSIGCMVSGTYTRQLRSAKSSIKSNNWLMSYVIEGLFGFILFRCSSYILQTPRRCRRMTGTKSKFAQLNDHLWLFFLHSIHNIFYKISTKCYVELFSHLCLGISLKQKVVNVLNLIRNRICVLYQAKLKPYWVNSDLCVNSPKAHLPYIHLLTHSLHMCGPQVFSWAGQAKLCETVKNNIN